MHIIYGICGEGLGHVGRSLTIIQRLQDAGHEVDICTSDDAYKFVEQSSNFPKERLHRIIGLRFVIKNNAVNTLATVADFIECHRELNEGVNKVKKLALEKDVKLFITDFEPVVPRVAAKMSLPLVSIDNQHYFLRKQQQLPLFLKTYCFFASIYLRWLVPAAKLAVICAFHEDKDDSRGRFRMVRPIIREKIIQKAVTKKDHILIYIKPHMLIKVLSVLRQIKDQQFIVYGVAQFANNNNIVFKDVSDDEFISDLASCKGVVCSAGNQLIGECVYLGKPLLVLPMANQHEQTINAFYVKKEKFGESCVLQDFSVERLQRFLNTSYSRAEAGTNGADQVMTLLQPFLQN